MTVMKNFFKSIEWWKLVPSHDLVLNQSVDETLKVVVSQTTDKNLVLLHTDMAAGHGGASGRFKSIDDTARQYAFMMLLLRMNL